MPADPPPSDLLRRSIVVTGTHYSATTVVGALLATAPEYHLLHEPLNPRPTRSFDSLQPAHWYEFFDEDRFDALRGGLEDCFARRATLAAFARKLGGARSGRELARALRYAHRKLPFLLDPRPAVIKDPFLAFSALTLQRKAGLKTVLCVRHPAAFTESFVRKAERFDFGDLQSQPALLAKVPHEAAAINAFAAREHRPEEQAALLWRIVYGFAAAHLLPDKRTLAIRQEDLASDRARTVERLFSFAGASGGSATKRFLKRNFAEGPADHGAGTYIRRDPGLAAHKWRDRLDRKEIETVRAMTGELAQSFGYGDESWSH